MSAPITVVGSLNMDFVVQVAALPRPGETVLGGGFATLPGGKGADQACAAAKLGGRVRMVGRVGDDVLGRALRESLASAGVDTAAVLATEGTASESRSSRSGRRAEPDRRGARRERRVERERRAHALGGAASGFLLLQLESPLETIEGPWRSAESAASRAAGSARHGSFPAGSWRASRASRRTRARQ